MARTIAACIRCGSDQLRIPTTGDGVIAGMTEGSTLVCARCGHRGPEILFDDEKARAAYERAQGSGGAPQR